MLKLVRKFDAAELQHKLWLSCDHLPSVGDCIAADQLMKAYQRDARAYNAGICDDPRPNPELWLLGVLGIVVMRWNGQQVFVPAAMRTLRGCRCA